MYIAGKLTHMPLYKDVVNLSTEFICFRQCHPLPCSLNENRRAATRFPSSKPVHQQTSPSILDGVESWSLTTETHNPLVEYANNPRLISRGQLPGLLCEYQTRRCRPLFSNLSYTRLQGNITEHWRTSGLVIQECRTKSVIYTIVAPCKVAVLSSVAHLLFFRSLFKSISAFVP